MYKTVKRNAFLILEYLILALVLTAAITATLHPAAAGNGQGYGANELTEAEAEAYTARMCQLQQGGHIETQQRNRNGQTFNYCIMAADNSGYLLTDQESATLQYRHGADNRLHIYETNPAAPHRLRTIQIENADLTPYIHAGKIRLTHYNAAGLPDATWIQTVEAENGVYYLESLPFSEVVIGGFSGTTTQTTTVIYSESNVSGTGNPFTPSQINSFSATVTPTYNETGPMDIPTDGLVAAYWFDENGGTTLIDSSGNGNNGTISGMTWVDGKYNYAGNFDGVDDFVNCGNSGQFNVTNLSILVYGNFSDGLFQTIISKTYKEYELRVDSSNRVQFYKSDGAGSYETHSFDGAVVPPGINSQIVLTFCGSTKKSDVYINSDFKDSCIYSSSCLYDGTNSDITIGSRDSIIHYMNGSIDHVLIYNRVLNETEIKQIYYDSIQNLKIKTNSNSTYSDQINGSGTVTIPYGSTDEEITSLTCNVPDEVEINGVTVRNYSETITPFTLEKIISYTENTTLISETSNAGTHLLNISFTPAHDYSAGEQLTYTTTDTDLTGADYAATPTISTTCTGSTVSRSGNTYTITTGSNITADETYHFNITTLYNHAPTLTMVDLTGYTGENVQFSATYNDGDDLGAASYLWTFGDSQTSTQASPLYAYPYPGTYYASVQITETATTNPQTITETFTVTIEDGPGSPGELPSGGSSGSSTTYTPSPGSSAYTGEPEDRNQTNITILGNPDAKYVLNLPEILFNPPEAADSKTMQTFWSLVLIAGIYYTVWGGLADKTKMKKKPAAAIGITLTLISTMFLGCWSVLI